MKTWVDEYATMLKDCEKRSEWLTEWDRGFVESLRRQIADGRQPSAKQIEKLDNVWERVTAMRHRTAATNYAGHGETKFRLGAATASAADGQRKPAKRRVS